MFSLTFNFCKLLVRSKSVRLICTSASINKNKTHSQPEIPPVKFDLSEITKGNPLEIFKAVEFVKEVKGNDNIDWETLINKLSLENIGNPATKLLQACLQLKDVNLAEKYYGYLIEKGHKWSVFDKIYFCKVLLNQKSLIPKYKEVFISLYDQVKPLLNSSKVIQHYLNELFVEIPHTYENLIQHQSEVFTENLALKAAELKDIKTAFELMNNQVKSLNPLFFKRCARACIENAKDDKFPIDFMNKLVEFCARNLLPINSEKCMETLRSLFNDLNKHETNYDWSVQDCIVKENTCSSCLLSLKPNTLTLEEFEELRADFLNSVILKMPLIHSTNNELQRYLDFLKNSQPYDIVIDALNLIYLRRITGASMVHHYMQHFLEEGYNLLVVARQHVKRALLKPAFINHYKNKKRIQYFFTENMSSDDIFILYSALHSGPNTKVVTGDLLRNFSGKLSPINRCRFIKWQMSNQFSTDFSFDKFEPVQHCGLPQVTQTPTKLDKRYVWHLSYQCTQESLNRRTPIRWMCVTATKKK